VSTDGILRNGGLLPLSQVPELDVAAFRHRVLEATTQRGRLTALFGTPAGDRVRLVAVVAWPDSGLLSVATTLVREEYPALTPECPAAHLFERELAETWRLRPAGHPWLKPVRGETPRRSGPEVWPGQSTPAAAAGTDFFQVSGEEVHEVAVGPVHAGIIEPGHFRFQCHGETVHHLEIALGYQHRGVERRLTGGPDRRSAHYAETLAGDTTVGHGLAYAQIIEALAGCRVPARAQVIRGIALELERLANHVGDLGALAGDVGYLPTLSYCGRIRGDLLNLTAALCGSRFGRGLVRPGGVAFTVDRELAGSVGERLVTSREEAEAAVDLLWDSPSVMARFEGTGVLEREVAEAIGLVGVATRACGLPRDVRHDHPLGIWALVQVPVATWDTGDVLARAHVRWQEIQRSAAFCLEQLAALPEGPTTVPVNGLAPDHLAVSLVEGWRGEICHVALTDPQGRFAQYKVVDPSFHNWFGLALALRQEQISDFPLCNKSFNLSYCGHDL
jgi:Ni,Fe-hydrogenase III large subunit